MNLQRIPDALLTVCANVYHYEAPKNLKLDRYLVWAEDGRDAALWADGRMQGQAVEGTIDLFTRYENDAAFDRVQAALDAARVPYRLNSIQHERDTGLIHYEWVWELWQNSRPRC